MLVLIYSCEVIKKLKLAVSSIESLVKKLCK